MKPNKFLQQFFCAILALGLTLSSANAQIAWGGTPTVSVDTAAASPLITATYLSRSPIDLYRVVVMQQNGLNWQIGGQYYVADTTWVYDNTLPDSLSQLIVIPIDDTGQEQLNQSQVSPTFRLSPKGPPIIITIIIDREAAPGCSTAGGTPTPISTAFATPESVPVMYGNVAHTLQEYAAALNNHPVGTTISAHINMSKDCSTTIKDIYDAQISFPTQGNTAANLTYLKACIQRIIAAAQRQCTNARMPIANGVVILRAE